MTWLPRGQVHCPLEEHTGFRLFRMLGRWLRTRPAYMLPRQGFSFVSSFLLPIFWDVFRFALKCLLGFFRLGLEGKFVIKQHPVLASFDSGNLKLEKFAFHLCI
jgi:hypothetical protein